MSYKVYFGPLTLYGAEKVDVALARPVTVHNGLGFGEYPTPDDRKLREWTVKGQWTEKNDYRLAGWAPAHELIADLKSMMGSDEPERLVMTNGYDKTSVLAYVTDVNATETCAGVYDVTVKLTEYRKPVVRTTGVPAISRPGKIPEMPKTMTFDKPSDVGEDAVKRGNDAAQQGKPPPAINYFWTDENGVMHQTNSPHIVPLTCNVGIDEIPPAIPGARESTHLETFGESLGAVGSGVKESVGVMADWVKKTFDSISDAIQDSIDRVKAKTGMK